MPQVEWAEAQLAEIELLTSMFPSVEELELTDQLAVAELRDFVEGSDSAHTPPRPHRPQFLIKQRLDTANTGMTDVILSCAYPTEYPSVLPEITVRCAGLSRAQQTQLHTALNAHLVENCLGEVCVLSAVDWVKDNLQLFISKSLTAAPAPKKEAPPRAEEVFTRLWIYSHHIYNKTKRKNILEWSKELGLSGFSMPGKPGVVCVEGLQSTCEEFWSRVKVLTWKKIMIRHREDIPLDRQCKDSRTGESVESLRKFTGFEEAMFAPHGNRGNHMDLGQLYQFLSEKGCCDVFQMYFGIEGR
ncbi:RWD domain-containing protein 2B [Limanda limanda]|uniref:RWD domain-containing protein 2B n=1 Tax=Limanda limanda TaxID=27771 RepID=UPI0029C93CD9|nr:RWD domain-containing protein 2B [Limanda limanda]XP_060929262.1 RWD domain-containing protein 2B [Limanda limanda]